MPPARWLIETARLALREMTPDDLAFVTAMLGDPEVMRFYPEPLTRDGALAWIERQQVRYRVDGHGLWLVVSRETRQAVGQVGLTRQKVDGKVEPELGYLLHRPFWRHGYATEAALAVRDHAFANLGYPRIISLIRPANVASQAVARRVGMVREATTLHADLLHEVWAVGHPHG